MFAVDQAYWDTPGILYGKRPLDCSPQEMFEEVRAQFRQSMGEPDMLSDASIHSWALSPALKPRRGGGMTHTQPMFATTPGCFANQPNATTKISNLFLASAYVRSQVGIDCMDAANEAGKRAANGVLAAAHSRTSGAPVPSGDVAPENLKTFWDADDALYEQGLPNAFDVVAPVYPGQN